MKVARILQLRTLEIREKKPTLPIEIARAQAAEQLFEELANHVRDMFKDAADEGLYLGMGKDIHLSTDEQEGPKVKKLRELVGL